MESLFTVGNGYLGVRGALDSPLPGALDDMFIAGIYDRTQPLLPYSEPQLLTEGDSAHEELVSFPFPFRVRLTIGGTSQELGSGHRPAHCRTLDMQSGILVSEVHFELDGNRNALSTRRLASLVDLHLLLQEIIVELENHSAMVELDATLAPQDVARRFPHLEPLDELPRNAAFEVLHFRTKAARGQVVIAPRPTLCDSGTDSPRWRVPGVIGARLKFRRFVVVYTSRDAAHPTGAAVKHLFALEWSEFDSHAALHCARWREFWQGADIRIADQPQVEQALRFNAYHLRSAADHDPRVSIAARTLSGRGYQGHVFWDVEMFMLPFFVYTQPDIARQLLLYRYYTPRRRAAARPGLGLSRCLLRLGIDRDGRGRDASRRAPEDNRADDTDLHRISAGSHHCRCSACGVPVPGGNGRRRVPARFRRGDVDGDRTLLGKPLHTRWRCVPPSRRDGSG